MPAEEYREIVEVFKIAIKEEIPEFINLFKQPNNPSGWDAMLLRTVSDLTKTVNDGMIVLKETLLIQQTAAKNFFEIIKLQEQSDKAQMQAIKDQTNVLKDLVDATNRSIKMEAALLKQIQKISEIINKKR